MTGHELNSLLWDSSFSLDLGLLSICGRLHLNLVLIQTLILSCSFLVTAYILSCLLLRFKSKHLVLTINFNCVVLNKPRRF